MRAQHFAEVLLAHYSANYFVAVVENDYVAMREAMDLGVVVVVVVHLLV